MHEYGFGLVEKPGTGYDAVVVAVNHREYLKLDESYFKSICAKEAVIIDLKGILRGKINNFKYWSL
jgi:UDP-N-acetyl-D-galactosamine dehydrogenase